MWRTGEDEEDSRNEGQDGAVGSHVADVVEDEADEHEEQADQGEGRGRANHLWGWEADTRTHKQAYFSQQLDELLIKELLLTGMQGEVGINRK